MSKPRTILWDVETSHNIVATFQNWGRHLYIQPDNVIKERVIICAAWKELESAKVSAVSAMDNKKRYHADPHDDYHIVRTMRDVLASADMIVHHNGRAFDIKYLETRIVHHGIEPLPPLIQIDTKLLAKCRFLFNYNSLDYLARFLKVGTTKLHTTNQLWLDWLTGTPAVREKALKQLITYNKHDVIVLEKVFQKLRPYAPNHINRQLLGELGCPRCGSLKTQARGIHKALTRTYQRYQCQSCGGWWRLVKANSGSARARPL